VGITVRTPRCWKKQEIGRNQRGLPGQTTSEENARLKRTVAEVTLDKVRAEGLGGKKQNN
jgi:urease alpha subunit